jgi:hypothetical protein
VEPLTIPERLMAARAQLRVAIENSLVPLSLTQTAQRCLIDLDFALSGGMSDPQARMLLAQVAALVSVIGDPGTSNRGGHDADSQ